MIRFLLNDTPIELENCCPSRTILDWVRTKMVKTGTKEGCATGDCGACTLLVGEWVNSAEGKLQWHYKTMNSCLMLVGNAHGKHIVTVEGVSTGLQPTLAMLHPVQRAMVECHGSQCGFCTPGIIMSLLALYINHKTYPGRKATIHALGGNLCRCTGYAPILQAAKQAFAYERVPETWSAEATKFSEQIAKHEQVAEVPFLVQKSAKFYVPQTLPDLLHLKAQYPEAYLVAGGTDLAIELSQRLLRPNVLISTAQVRELTQQQENNGQLVIGAAVTYQQLTSVFCQYYPEAKELFERLGSAQVRNSGTLGGSIANASPIGDPAPLLIALNASIELQSNHGKRTLPVEDFFTGYRQTVLADNEVISKIIIPKRSAALKLACHKKSKRFEDDISTVCLVLAIEHRSHVITSARCAMGGMAATPARAKNIEQQLIGAQLSSQSFINAANFLAQDFTPMSDVRASAHYRLTVSKNLLQRIGVEFCQTIPVINVASNTMNTVTRISHASL